MPPKHSNTPTAMLGCSMLRVCTPSMESRKIPMAKESNPNGEGLAKDQCTEGKGGGL